MSTSIGRSARVLESGLFRSVVGFLSSILLLVWGGSAVSAQSLAWVKSGAGMDDGTGLIGYSAGGANALDSSGNVYVGGDLTGSVDLSGDGVADLGGGAGGSILLAKYSAAGGLEWARTAAGELGGQIRGVVADGAGHVYAAGFVGSSTDFDDDGSTDVTVGGIEHMFVARYAPDGTFEWVRSACGQAHSVAADSEGAVVVTGRAAYCADFDGDGSADGTHAPGIFLAKYEATGAFAWVRFVKGDELGEGLGVAVDRRGNINVTGYVSGRADFDLDANVDVNAANSADIFLARYSAAGELLWVRAAGASSQDDWGFSVAAGNGSIYVAGFFTGAADFSGDGVADLVTNDFGDAFLLKYDVFGDFQWVRAAGTNTWDEGRAVALDALGNVYMTGIFNGQVDFDADGATDVVGFDDVFIAKYSATGVLQWVRAAGGASTDVSRGIAADSNGNVYVTGLFSEVADFNGDGASDATAVGPWQLFLVKYAADTPTADDDGPIPAAHTSLEAYPNPFHTRTVVTITNHYAGKVRVELLDLLGRRLRVLHDGFLTAGSTHRFEVDGASLRSGAYVIHVVGEGTSAARAVALIK